jgi:hypothetical protein
MRMRELGNGLWVWGSERSPAEFASLPDELDALRRLDLRSDSDGTIRRALNAFGRGYITRNIVVRNPRATTFRARPDAAVNPWANVEELWARKAKDATAGRFNEAGHPVLYTASDPFTALREVRAQPNTFAVVLVIKVLGSPTFAQFGFDRVPQFGIWKEIMGEVSGGLGQEPEFRDFAKRKGIYEYWQIQDQAFGDIAAAPISDEEREKYRLTWQLGWQLQRGNSAHGLQYPTVARNNKALNMCSPALNARQIYHPSEAWLIAIGPDPLFDPHEQTDPREPIVIRRGAVEQDDRIIWGTEVRLPLHQLHRQISPIPDA